jgi:hypothetical protein
MLQLLTQHRIVVVKVKRWVGLVSQNFQTVIKLYSLSRILCKLKPTNGEFPAIRSGALTLYIQSAAVHDG